MIESKIFTPCNIGPVTLRNRVIRSAAFENMAYHNSPSQDLSTTIPRWHAAEWA